MVSSSRNNGSFLKTDGSEDVLIFQIKTTGVLSTLTKQHTLWKCQGHSFSKEKSIKSYCCITGVGIKLMTLESNLWMSICSDIIAGMSLSIFFLFPSFSSSTTSCSSSFICPSLKLRSSVYDKICDFIN